MRIVFWIRRFLLVAAAAFAILVVVYLVKGRAPHTALIDAALWSCVSAAIFVGTRIYWLGKGRACALCNDSPVAPAHS